MSTITAVEPQLKNKSRFNIFIDGNFAFGADEDLIVSERLVVGKIIEPRGFDKLLYEAEVGKLMQRMYGLFSIRARSEKEIRDYLKVKSQKSKVKNGEEISQMTIDCVVKKLKEKGMINDLEFAKAWVEARRRSKQKGINVLKQELYQKGISRDVIEEVLRLADARSGQFSEEDLAKIALEKKMRVWKNLEPQEFKKKAINFLMRKGFGYELSRSVVEKVVGKE